MHSNTYFPIVSFVTLLLLQALFWYGVPGAAAPLWQGTRHVTPSIGIVPDVPNDLSIKAAAFGDDQFLFRVDALRIQQSGDTFGRYTPLKDYNHAKLEAWYNILDLLDARSNYVPSMAAYIFAQSQNSADTIHVIRYLEQHANRDIGAKWWWMMQAVYIAKYRLKDDALALKLAYHLYHAPPSANIPVWARQMPAYIHANQGETEAALAIIYGISEQIHNIPQKDLDFMNHFIHERLGLVQSVTDALSRKNQEPHAKEE